LTATRKLAAADLVPWETANGTHGLAVIWTDGSKSAFPIAGTAWADRATIRVEPDEGLWLLGCVIALPEFREYGRYHMTGDRRHLLELPTVVFEWFAAEDARAWQEARSAKRDGERE
jgi:hypothetical protein